jgi:hypothetical protein
VEKRCQRAKNIELRLFWTPAIDLRVLLKIVRVVLCAMGAY